MPDLGDGAVFAALADPTRRSLVDRLAGDGPGTATELAADYPMSRQAVVKHLTVLQEAGLVVGERRGREVRFHLAPERLAAATSWLDEVGRRWDHRLAALSRRLSDPIPPS